MALLPFFAMTLQRKAAMGMGLLVLIAILIIVLRTLFVPSRQVTAKPAPAMQLDRHAAVARLSRAIQFQTVSHAQPGAVSAAEHAAFVAWLSESYPHVHRVLTREVVDAGSLLYRWQGTQPQLPALLLLAHMDVVPVEPQNEANWSHPPFSGALADGFVWGRGALDDKSALLAILEAAENLIAMGFAPKQTIVLAFGHDEEVGGKGAQAMARLLESRGVKVDALIDEGGIIAQNLLQGVSAPVALVGIAEKGYVSVVLQANGNGGHSSMPPPLTPVGRVSRAIDRIQTHPFAADLRGATEQMFRFLAPEMNFGLRIATANLWLFEPLIEWQGRSSPSLNATLRTTLAPTVISGGVKENVIAPSARAVVNARILQGDSIQKVLSHIQAATNDPELHIEAGSIQAAPSPISDPDSPQFTRLARSIRSVYPDAVVAPYLVVAATDARHYRTVTKNIFRFAPIRLGPQDLPRLHGVDERIAVADFVDAIRFYRALIVNWR